MRTGSFLLVILLFFISSCHKEKLISDSALPAGARNFIEAYYPGIAILEAKLIKNGTNKKYTAKLVNETNLEFAVDGNIRKIESENPLPEDFLGSSVKWYISTNYPSESALKWELTTNAQEVTLSSAVKLIFDRSGGFIKIA